LLVVALVVGSLWLTRRFRRLINIPIAIAGMVVLLLLVVGGSIQAGAVSDADAAVDGPLAGADNAAQARAAAFEARSQQALTLINRGNGAANEANWQTGNSIVLQALGRELGGEAGQSTRAADSYNSYRDAHAEIRALDDRGNWDQAVAVSLGEPTSAGVNAVAAFNDFDQIVGEIATIEGASASQRLGDAAAPLRRLRNIVFVAGLVIAALAALGYGQRLKEYR
jgi:hypothetical protein